MAALLQQPRQPDDRREQEDGAEEEQRVGHVELRGLVVRGVVVLLPVLGGVRWVIVAARTTRGATIMKMPKPTARCGA